MDSNVNSHNWQFQNEAALEDFVWKHLELLLDITPLARQFWVNNQVCDILAVAPNQQLTIVELKNGEDRYIIQQLTRYYRHICDAQPFGEQVDYRLPVRLVAIAPQFHAHSLIDQEYSRLTFELMTFSIQAHQDEFWFELRELAGNQIQKLSIASPFQRYLIAMSEATPEVSPLTVSPRPPKSLQTLLAALSPEQQQYVLDVRDRLLNQDERLYEVGRSTSTVYGLRKGTNEVYTSKLCAEFLPLDPGVYFPRLLLLLPHPKREFGAPGRCYKQERVKGLAWAEIRHQELWNAASPLQLYFYFGKTRSRYSKLYDLSAYRELYQTLTQQTRSLQSLDDLIDLALDEWQQRLGESEG
jgi:hypothetical protein